MAKDDFNNDEITSYYSKIYQSIDNDTTTDPFGNYVLTRIKGGQKTVLNKTQSEIRNFDMSFLDTIESVYPAILKIMRDPKKSLRYEEEIVAVEKAKKVNSQTVRHLSSHTQLIKEITKAGDVIPSKVMTTYAEEELAIYENRFLKSLVKRMEMFLERRYEVMKVSLESFETERLQVKNDFKVSGQQVSVSLDVQIKNDLTTNVETTKEQYNRLLYIREMVQGLKGTDFMRALAKARDVLPPIMKTNILMHNPDFKLCYGLWLYLDKVDGIATNIDVKEKSYKFSQNFDNDINKVMALALTTFIKNRQIDDIYSTRKLPQVKPPKPIIDNTPELEMNFNADNNKIEDYTMNEFLLSQTAKFFESSMEGFQSTGGSYSESIRVVYRQMLDMLDQIYVSTFGISDDELNSKDPYEQLEYARKQMMVTKIVHQQKQMNLARMGKEEKRIEKLISSLEDRIKKEEAREREKQELERARVEAERQAQIEREKAKEARKRKYEQDAIAKAKELEHRRQEMLSQQESKKQKRREDLARIFEAHNKKQEHLKEVQAQENENFKDMTPEEFAEQEPAPVPHVRRDEFDDLSDQELNDLLEANALLDAIPEAEKDPDEDVVEAKAEDAPKAQPENKKKKTSDISDDLDDISDDDLDALLAENGMLGDSDFNFNSNDLDDEKPKKEENKPTIGKKKPKAKEETPVEAQSKEPEKKSAPVLKKKAKEEPKPEEPIDEPVTNADIDDDISDEDLDKLLAENGILDDGEDALSTTPKEDVKPEAEKKAAPAIKKKAKEEPKPEPVKEPEVSSDDLDDISDEDLAKLMAENGIEDDLPDTPTQDIEPQEEATVEAAPEVEEEPQEEPTQEETAPVEETPIEEPSSDVEDLDASSDELPSDDISDDISDDDLDALLAANDMEDLADSSSGDVDEDISDDDLEALLKENGML